MIPKECKRLAEVDFPIAVVSKHAAREKSIRPGHPSTLHLWWARRPPASCPAVLLARLLPASHAKTRAAAEAKYLTNCDLYIGQVSQGTSSRKKLSSTVAPGVLLKLAALRKEPKGEAEDTGWPTWGAFCRLAQDEATPLLGLRGPEEQWAVFEHFAVRFFGEEAKAVLKHCDLEPTKEAREAVKKELAPPKPKPASPTPKPEAGPTQETGKPA